MSSLKRQLDVFRSDVSSSSSKLQKRTIVAQTQAQAASAPSPATSTGSSTGRPDGKRKREREELPRDQVWSQPADTGKGHDIMTNVQYAVDHLKEKSVPLKLADIFSYLSVPSHDEKAKRTLAHILKTHPRVRFHADEKNPNLWGAGTYTFRPTYDIANATQLLAFLQQQKTAKGLLVKDLKDGWPNVEETIDVLEKEHKLLVTRNKKDDHARAVWLDDPSLFQTIDNEYRLLWHKIVIPAPPDLPGELTKLDLKPTSVDPTTVVKKMAPKEKAKKKPRKGGRTTNLHMAGILKDFSHMKR